ncbi:ubiquitin-like-specific protease 1 isoform X3 [Gastrolobium bilobum]|uniref:ubiquitin-like-specific protease 1 isoform X3 n=1 Tax=Gastrolobium bilobum TaxID=150636 RepID=UPI002AB0BEA6|nr:ubiquitin-like-specific protease 1 isoform X3 [Gastrolobium bilobum]
MAPKRKNPSRSTRAGGILKATKSEAIEPSSSAVRASSTQQVKRALNQSSLSMLNKLYYFCTRRPKAYEELSVLVSMFGLYLNRKDSSTLRPKGWISNTVILVAGKIMMEEEKATDGVVTRHMFSPHFMIFAPTLFEEHWSCYAFEPENKTLYVLDSMPDKVSISKKNLDDATKLRFEELLVLKNPSLTQENASITLLHVDVPMQPNNHDCGIYVLKYMETWDGSIKWEDKTMPDYSYKEIVKFRQSLICGWVQHPKNEVREEILKEAGVWGKL